MGFWQRQALWAAVTARLICVNPDDVGHVWPGVRHFIASAFEHGRGDDNAEIVFADLKARHSLLWTIWDQEQREILAALTTKLIMTPRGLVCRITSCGGNELVRWYSVISGIESYAKAEGCRSVRFEGRRGWKAFFPDYAERWVMLEKRL